MWFSITFHNVKRQNEKIIIRSVPAFNPVTAAQDFILTVSYKVRHTEKCRIHGET